MIQKKNNPKGNIDKFYLITGCVYIIAAIIIISVWAVKVRPETAGIRNPTVSNIISTLESGDRAKAVKMLIHPDLKQELILAGEYEFFLANLESNQGADVLDILKNTQQ